jgi:hypothetical protein
MKFPIAVVVFLVACGHTTFSQVKYGLKAGINLSDVAIINYRDPDNYTDPDYEAGFDLKFGLHAGVFGRTAIADKVDFIAEIQYINKGVKANTRIDLHYISIPLLAAYEISDNIFIEAGPEVSYLAAARSRYGNVSNLWNNKIDLSLDAGLQFMMEEKISLSIRYCAGFLSVIDFDSTYGNSFSSGSPRFQNRALQFHRQLYRWREIILSFVSVPGP